MVTTEIYRVVYLSTATTAMRDVELNQILAVAQANNRQNGLTGMLLLRGEYFIQLLEGAKSQVLETFQKIQRDHRHKNLKVLIEGVAAKRVFPSWSMGSIADVSNLDEGLLKKIEVLAASGGDPSQLAIDLVKAFRTLRPEQPASARAALVKKSS